MDRELPKFPEAHIASVKRIIEVYELIGDPIDYEPTTESRDDEALAILQDIRNDWKNNHTEEEWTRALDHAERDGGTCMAEMFLCTRQNPNERQRQWILEQKAAIVTKLIRRRILGSLKPVCIE